MDKIICIVGLGYVGLPLSVEFAKNNQDVIGFDVDIGKIDLLNKETSPIGDISDIVLKDVIKSGNIIFTSDEHKIKDADFVIVAVPTPITESRKPDLKYIESAAKVIGRNLKPGVIVILE